MSGSSPTYNYPEQPSYGEGMADAMKAQMQQLLGQGDYAEIYAKAGFEGGNFGDILAGVEAPIRKQTAQIDTDVMRQTLLGGDSDHKYAEDGRVITGYTDTGEGTKKNYVVKRKIKVSNPKNVPYYGGDVGEPTITTMLIDTETGNVAKEVTIGVPNAEVGGDAGKGTTNALVTMSTATAEYDDFDEVPWASESARKNLETFMNEQYHEEFANYLGKDQISTLLQADSVADINWKGGDGEATVSEPIYKKNPDGSEFVAKPGTFEPGAVPREGTGMVDLLGDKRGVTQYDTRTATQEDVNAGLADAVGDAFIAETQTADQAGFREGEFMGLSALAEDVQAGNLSRQRERDLQDVSRLSGLYSDIMEDYKPGTKAALTGASEVLEAQKAALTGAGAIDAPGSVATGMGDITSGGMTAAQAGLPADLTADTGYEAASAAAIDPLSAATSYTPSAGVSGGAYGGALGADPATLRSDLLADAQTSLAGGLTPREERQISEAFKAQSTMMGRTFDQAGGLAEAKARTLEDRNRQAINRQYAQQVLGQEAGLQESDLGRGLQAQLANQQATNRAAEYGVGAGLQQEQAGAQFDQQTALANQQAANRAAEFGVGAGMQQELAGAQMNLQTALANQAAQQDAAKYTAQEDIQVQLANEANRQQVASFDVNALQQQQLLNEQLKQAGTLGYVDAATRLAALEDTTTLDPFQAVLGRTGGGSLQAGQGVFGQAGYGLQSGPQYLNAESGLGFIQNQATNAANMYGAQQMAGATTSGGIMGGLGSLAGGLLGNPSLFT